MTDVAALKQLLNLAGDPKKLQAELDRLEASKTQLNEKLKGVRDETDKLKAEAKAQSEDAAARQLAVAQREDVVHRAQQKLDKDREEFEAWKKSTSSELHARDLDLIEAAEKLKLEKADHAEKSQADRDEAAKQAEQLAKRDKEATRREKILSEREKELAAAVNAYEDRARRLREALQ